MTDINQLFEQDINENRLIEAIEKFFEYEDKNIKTKTDIPKNEIKKIVKIYFYANLIRQYDKETAKIIDRMLHEYYQLRVSKDRLGREEFFKAISNYEEDTKEKKRIWEKILNL